MNCPRCETKAYYYERHGFWQCPNSACNHSWKDDATTAADNEQKLREGVWRWKKINGLHAAIADVESRAKLLASDADLEKWLEGVAYLREIAREMK